MRHASTFRKAVFSLYCPFHAFVLWPFSNLCEYESCLRLWRAMKTHPMLLLGYLGVLKLSNFEMFD